MDDRLALAVGKIILAWGRLDQQLHLLISASERRLKLKPSKEGRFTERRKIFRRLCLRVAQNDPEYERKIDRILAELVRLERARGTIAHGFATESEIGAFFFNAPEAMATIGDKAAEDLLRENHMTFGELESLERDIDKCHSNLVRIMLDAPRA